MAIYSDILMENDDIAIDRDNQAVIIEDRAVILQDLIHAIRESGLAYDYFYACGPLPMLRALSDVTKCSGQLSFEERMGCGFGACMGCSCKTKYGNKRICKEGPVLTKEEVIW